MTPRVLRIELRRSGLPLWIIPLLFVVLGLVFTETIQSTGGGRLEWSTSIFYNMNAVVVLASTLALAAAAWRAGRERRQGMRELIESTPRARSQRALAAWLPVAIWPTVAYLPAVLAFGLLSMSAVSGPPLFGVLAAGVTTVIAYAALGFAIGSYVPGRFTAPVAGVAAFIAAVGLGSVVPHGLLSAIPQPTYGTIASHRLGVGLWDRPVWWLAPATALWLVALTVTLLVLSTARRRRLALLPLVLAVLVAIPLVRTQVWRIDTASPLLACSDGAVRVCVPRATGVQLDAVAASTRPVRSRLTDLPAVAPQGPAAATSARAYIWPQRCRAYLGRINCQSPQPATAGTELSQQTAGWQCSSTAPPATSGYSSPAPRLERSVRAWLLGNTAHTAPQLAQRIAALPDQQRQEWLSRYLVAADRCDVGAIDGLRLS